MKYFNNNKIAIAAQTMLLPSLLVPAVAFSQQVSDEKPEFEGLEIIEVTARKRVESILEVPESLTAMSSGMIEKAGIDTLSDIGLQVPNLYMSTRLDGFPNVSIRGLGGFGNTQGVGFYLDDVQLFSDASSRFGDMERIEVLKGPQGILYGGSNIGGAVKFVTKRPDTLEFEGKVKVGVGDYGFRDAEAQFNIPLSEDWALRLFAFTESDDSYLTNPNSPRLSTDSANTNADVGKRKQNGVRLSLYGEPTANFTVYGTLRYNDFDGPNNIWSREVNTDFTYTDQIDTSFNPRQDRETTAGSLELTYDFDSVVLTSITSYTDTEMTRESDLDISPEFILDLIRPEDLTTTTQEIRLSSNTSSPFEWQLGAYYLDLKRELASELLVYEGFCFLDPGVCDPAPGTSLLARDPFEVSDRTREQKAIFANASYRWDNLELGIGVRLDDWKSTRTNRLSGLAGEQSDTEFLMRVSGAYFLEQSGMIYLTVSQGYEPGDLNLANFAGESSLFGYENESATQYELGYKNRLLNNRLDFYAAVFAIDYKDRQFELQAADPNGGFIEGIINVGDSQQWGFETDIRYAIADNWVVSASFGYVDAEWDEGTILVGSDEDISGLQPPNIARVSSALGLEYTTEVSDSMIFSSRLGLQHKGDSSTNSQFFPGGDLPIFENPGFTILNFNATLEWQQWKVAVLVENITDEEYYVDVQQFPNFAGGALDGPAEGIIIGTLEPPRRVKFSLNYMF